MAGAPVARPEGMRNMVLLAIVAASACATRPSHSTFTTEPSCESNEVVQKRATTELMMPAEPRPASAAYWHFASDRPYTPPGSTNAALSRWMAGETIDTVAKELSIDREQAKHEIRQALMSAQTRYWRER